jgi:hypothetical protein
LPSFSDALPTPFPFEDDDDDDDDDKEDTEKDRPLAEFQLKSMWYVNDIISSIRVLGFRGSGVKG